MTEGPLTPADREFLEKLKREIDVLRQRLTQDPTNVMTYLTELQLATLERRRADFIG